MEDNKWLQKWLKIRKELYRQLESEVSHRLGRESADLLSYRREYEAEFNKKWQAVPKEELLREMREARLVLVGDFHALHQSQKAFVRLLKNLSASPDSPSLVIGLECFYAEDQALIDRYVQGKGSEREFLKSIRWQEKWGFPWEHYRSILRWAQQNKTRVYGLNRGVRKYSAAGLKVRDQFAARQISSILKAHPQSLLVVQYGDLHLAEKHLPREVLALEGKAFRRHCLRLFQNAEKIYFQLLAREMESSVDVVRLSRQDFCLLSVPPWVKWQNYLMYLEEAYDLGLDEDDEDALDYTDHVGRYVRLLGEELGVSVNLDRLSVDTARDQGLWKKLEGLYSSRELKWVEAMIEEGRSFYLPEAGVAYLARASVNHAAGLAMQYLHAELSGRRHLAHDMPRDFTREIWIQTLSYFGSKMVNHKRKADTLLDIKASLASRNSLETGKEALQLALAQKMHELMRLAGRPTSRLGFSPRRKWSYAQAASLLGGILGERLYAGYRRKLISPSTLRNLLGKNIETENFEHAYYEILEIIEALPLPFKSKKEKL